VHVCGTSTKRSTVLQCFGLDHPSMRSPAERNPAKLGKVTLGTPIPIVSESEARAAQPEYFLALPYQFIEEFQEHEKDCRFSGGRFIMPFPHLTLI